MHWIVVVITEVLFAFLVNVAVRWAMSRMHLEHLHDRMLRWLERLSFRPTQNSLTTKEIVSKEIIASVDTKVISPPIRKRIQEELGHWGLIVNGWDKILGTKLSLDWKQFFVRLAPLLKETVVPNLNLEYDNKNIACFVTLPFPRTKKHQPIGDFLSAFEECLGSRTIHRESIAPAMLERHIRPEWLSRLKKDERILVLQPMAADDDYLERILAFIRKFSMGTVEAVITVIDASRRPENKRSESPPERILLDFDMRHLP